MQLPDDVMRMYFELLTDIEFAEIEAILKGHPKEAKVRLAKSVITEYHDESAGDEAAQRWQKEIGEGSLPTDLPEKSISRSTLDSDGCIQSAQLLKDLDLVPSTSEAGRRIKGGAVFYLVGEQKTPVKDRNDLIPITDGMIVRAGKKDMVTVRLVD